MNFYNKDLDEIFKEFDSSRNGMDQDKIQGRILEYGKNEIKEAKGKSPFKRFISQFNEPMIIILIIVAIIMFVYGYLFSHEYTDTIVITAGNPSGIAATASDTQSIIISINL